MTLKLDWKTEQ